VRFGRTFAEVLAEELFVQAKAKRQEESSPRERGELREPGE